MRLSIQKFLVIYSAVVSTVLLGVVLIGAKKPANPEFDVVRAHRIDVVEPDGTLRMVISNHDKLPPVIVRGKEQKMAEARPQAGMLFYNDEGTENGGLIFGGKKNEKGEVVDSGGSLSFDKYGAGQIVQLAGVDDKDNKFAGLAVGQGGQRIWIGHGNSGVASVSLSDANGKNRIVMQVAADGTPSLVFLDDQGRVVQSLAPAR
jgi:hypothetical protein